MKNILISWLLLFTFFCKAQETEQDSIDMDTVYIPKNSVYLELGGNAIVYSVNYERTLFKGKGIELDLRLGYMFLSYNQLWPTSNLPMFVNVSFLSRKGKYSAPILGIGTLFTINHNINKTVGEGIYKSPPLQFSLTCTFGYHFQWSKYGWFLRVCFTPLFEPNNRPVKIFDPFEVTSAMYFVPWLGFSLGYKF